MEFDTIRCAAVLAMLKVEEADPNHADPNVQRLELTRTRMRLIERLACRRDVIKKRARRIDAFRVGDLSDGGMPRIVGQAQMEVVVGFLLELGECRVPAPNLKFIRRTP